MGFVLKPKTYLIEYEDPQYAGLEVRAQGVPISQYMAICDRMIAMRSINRETFDALLDVVLCDVDLGPDARSWRPALLDWNVTDEDDKPIPLDRDAMLTADWDLVLATVAGWVDSVRNPGRDLGKESSSGGSSQEASLPMEALSAPLTS